MDRRVNYGDNVGTEAVKINNHVEISEFKTYYPWQWNKIAQSNPNGLKDGDWRSSWQDDPITQTTAAGENTYYYHLGARDVDSMPNNYNPITEREDEDDNAQADKVKFELVDEQKRTIAGNVWEDMEGSGKGLYDDGEKAIDGIKVELQIYSPSKSRMVPN